MSRSNSDILSEKNIKSTKQRRLILSVLNSAKFPESAENIFMAVKKEDSKISLSTVYRTLDIFVNNGIASKTVLESQSENVYEMIDEIHKHYLSCTSCKRILSINGCPISDYEKKLEEKTGFKITKHRLDLAGICPECKESIRQN